MPIGFPVENEVLHPLSLYVHIPFCQTKCPYCDFNTYSSIESMMPAYVGALCQEITRWGKSLNTPGISSIFFGGGTPSYLPTRDLKILMKAIEHSFQLQSGAEITLEANPGDITRDRARAMLHMGFNRMSIGVQSFDDQELSLLGRRHSSVDASNALDQARQAGFSNVNLDLMFGLPYQSLTSWEHTLERATELGPEHFSMYALTLESGTPMEIHVKSGRLQDPDPDLGAEMYLLAQSHMKNAGYIQYEISNWAKHGLESRHNLVYWKNHSYLGVGPGAHSYLTDEGQIGFSQFGRWGTRFAVTRSPRTYIQHMQLTEKRADEGFFDGMDSPLWEQVQKQDRNSAMAETMMMGLRLNEGVSVSEFFERFGVSIADQFPTATSECLELGLLEQGDGFIKISEYGRLLGNEVFLRFVTERS
jgi:oxygen-independent coproporphyrinogen-3 oxidase